MNTLSVEWNGERVTLTNESNAVLMDALKAMLQHQRQVDRTRLFPKKVIAFFADDCKVRYVSHSLVADAA